MRIIDAIEHYNVPTQNTHAPHFSSNEENIRENIRNGSLDECIVEIELQARGVEFNDTNMPPEIARVQESFSKMFSIMGKEESKKEVTVAEAKEILRQEAADKLLKHDQMKREAL
jgi:ATP-dependent HslUV protease ATP-binding subunit HslU